MARWLIEGHAIVCRNGCIADSEGRFPDALANDTDWARFQAALDRAAAVVLGRASHDATPNRAKRRRVILSRASAGLETRQDGIWWNPDGASVDDMLRMAAPEGGVIGVPGGRDTFDLLLSRLHVFELARNDRIAIQGGRPVLSGVGPTRPPEAVLEASGLVGGKVEMLDADAGVSVRRFERRGDAEPPAEKRRSF